MKETTTRTSILNYLAPMDLKNLDSTMTWDWNLDSRSSFHLKNLEHFPSPVENPTDLTSPMIINTMFCYFIFYGKKYSSTRFIRHSGLFSRKDKIPIHSYSVELA